MSLPFTDQTLVCRLCQDGFIFSAGEQELQRLRGVDRVPTRCSFCLRHPRSAPWLDVASIRRTP